MSTTLKNLIRPLTGYTLVQKTTLFYLADLAGPDGTVSVYTGTLAEWMCCNVRTAQRALRALEKKGTLTPLQEKAGRGYHHVYRINVYASPVTQPPVEDVPVVTEPLPPTNGAKPTTLTPEQLAERDAEQYARHKAKLEAMKAAIAAKKREERRERPGRSARHQAGSV